MSLENGILGYLSMKPMSGYDIKKLFNMSAAYFWPADQAQIYRSLKKLVDDGLIELSEHSKGETVNKKIYAITEKGRKHLYGWLTSPGQSDFIVRSPYMVKLFFSGTLSRGEQLGLINAQIEQSNDLIFNLKESFEKNKNLFRDISELSKDDPKINSALWAYRWGVLQCEAYVKFLKDIKSEIIATKN